MLLEDVLAITSEFTDVEVMNSETDEFIASYDGRDSIPSSYGKREVKELQVAFGELWIWV